MKKYLDKKQLEEEFKVEELRELAKAMGLSAKGKKAELIERIAAEEVEVPDEDEQAEKDSNDVPETDTIPVRVITTYRDLQHGEVQHKGDTFEVTKDRAATLVAAGVAELTK